MKKYPLLEPIRFLVRTLTKFKVENQERLPKTGGVLITTNHLSRLDTPILLAITDREDLVAIIAKKYQEKPFFKWVLDKVGTMIWIDRTEMTLLLCEKPLINCAMVQLWVSPLKAPEAGNCWDFWKENLGLL